MKFDINIVEHIIVAADYLLMVHAEFVFVVFSIGQHYYSSEFYVKSVILVASNFVEFKPSEKFHSLDKDENVTLLSRSDLGVKLNECIFIAITFSMKKSC